MISLDFLESVIMRRNGRLLKERACTVNQKGRGKGRGLPARSPGWRVLLKGAFSVGYALLI